MMYRVYSIFDRVTGLYGEPFIAVNEEMAKRRFNYLMDNSPMVNADCQLYYLGDFDSVNGTIGGKVDFVCGYEVKVNG